VVSRIKYQASSDTRVVARERQARLSEPGEIRIADASDGRLDMAAHDPEIAQCTIVEGLQ